MRRLAGLQHRQAVSGKLEKHEQFITFLGRIVTSHAFHTSHTHIIKSKTRSGTSLTWFPCSNWCRNILFLWED